jgi:aquaporin Z
MTPFSRPLVAEFIGTFLIVLFGCGAIITVNQNSGVIVPLVFGGVVALLVSTLGPISGAHFNPAVTLAKVAQREMNPRAAIAYVGVQLCGAIAASATLWIGLGAQASQASVGATIPTIGPVQTIIAEALMTGVLVLVAFLPSAEQSWPAIATRAGLAVGLSAAVGGPLTGASLNPARSIGPALFAQGPALQHLWIYLVGPCIGALAGVALVTFLSQSRIAPASQPDPVTL